MRQHQLIDIPQYSDVARLLQHYQLWLDELYPRAKFADGLAMIEKLGHTNRMQTMRKAWMEESKPRRRDEQEGGPEETPATKVTHEQRAGEDPTLMSGAFNSEGPKTPPPAQDMDDDLYGATPQAAKRTSAKGEAHSGEGLFVSDDEDGAGEPDGDELDALLAEDCLEQPGGIAQADKPTVTDQAGASQKDDFDDEMEAMAGMGDMW